MGRIWPLTVRGTAAAALAVVAAVAAGRIGSVQLLAFAVLLAAITVCSLILLHAGRTEIALERTWSPPSVSVGDHVGVRVHVRARSTLPTTPGTWSDPLPDGLNGRSSGRFPALPAGVRAGAHEVELQYEMDASTRGVHPLGPLRLTLRDPFGLARRTRDLGRTTPLVVAPACIDLPTLSTFAGADASLRQRTTTRLGQGTDNLIARPYEPGDSMRRIHWRATAHRDQLMVRQEERESAPEALVVLDDERERWQDEAATRPGADPDFESAVSACVSAVAALVRDGFTVQVIAPDGKALHEPIEGGDRAGTDALCHRLATLTARGRADVAAVAEQVTGGNAGPLVVITGRIGRAELGALASVPAHSTHPVLLCCDPDGQVVAEATAGGWAAASLCDQDLLQAWEQVSHTASTGADHVR